MILLLFLSAMILPIFNADIAKNTIQNAVFQSEPLTPGMTDLLGGGESEELPVTLRSHPMDVLTDDTNLYAHPKIQQYPRIQQHSYNNYGNNNNNNNYGNYRPSPPLGYSYVGYINRQARRYPVMMYTLVQCVPCQRAKHLLAVNYGDIPSHFLELVGDEDWQRQLQVDLLKVTRQATFPYVFVCGQFIGGSSDLFNLHHNGQLRQILNNCNSRG
ncbi:unnamed protein product [Caenorhabditis angaria]|uniref:Glutaredoxin domain-containing protein n=1 Tax=Caenorhabditis angaria TaxID=860376 RepID=A0A9P1MX15_9PELO|nr:unnamed protein product [Caenorhabditis angaria]